MFGFGKKKKIVDKIIAKNRKWISLKIYWKEFFIPSRQLPLMLIDKELNSNLPEAGITVGLKHFIQNKKRMNRLRAYPRKNKTLCLRIIQRRLESQTDDFYRLMFWNCLNGRFVGEISYDNSKKLYRITHLSKIKNRFLKWSN